MERRRECVGEGPVKSAKAESYWNNVTWSEALTEALIVPLLSAKRSMSCTFVGVTGISELVTVAIVAVDGGDGCGCFQARQKERTS